jgi:hypothetical protein
MSPRTIVLGALIASCFAIASSAQTASRLHEDMPASMRGLLGIELNRDSLASSQHELGPVKEWVTGDAGDAEDWWCYRSSSGADSAIVLFSSSGEMGGPGHEIDEIRLMRAAVADSIAAHCAPSPSDRNAATSGGLKLGLSRTAVIELLGSPANQGGDTMSYGWDVRRSMSPSESSFALWNARREECFGGKRRMSTSMRQSPSDSMRGARPRYI